MTLYGLATCGTVVEWHLTLRRATDALRDVLADEPTWRGLISVIEVDFHRGVAETVLC